MQVLSNAPAATSATRERQATPRLAFVDNLRVFIIMMVLSHHAGNPYSGGDFWYFKSPDPPSPLVALTIMLNPSYTMAILLVLSGYLLPASFDRRPWNTYLREKLIRLGIPLLIGGLVMLPLMHYYAFHLPSGYAGYASFWQYYWHAWHGLGTRPADWPGPGWPERNLAHLWYVEHLMFYALCYGAYRRYVAGPGAARRTPAPVPGHGTILLFALTVSAATFLVRIRCPYNQVYKLLGFLQIDMSHYPQWMPFFVVGLAAYRYDWLHRARWSLGKPWLILAGLLILLNFATAISPAVNWCFGSAAWSGWTPNSLYRSAWESFFCVGMTVGLITWFHEHMNFSGALSRTLAENAYAVHVFHPPMIVGLQFAVASLGVPVFFKFLFVSLSGVVVCFTISQLLIRRLPYARRVF